MYSRHTQGVRGDIQRSYNTLCGNCTNWKWTMENVCKQSDDLYDCGLICCGEASCKIDIHIPLHYPSSNDSGYIFKQTTNDVETNDVDSDGSTEELTDDSTEELTDDSVEVMDEFLSINKDSIELANDFAKHFDNQVAVGVKSTWLQTKVGDWTNQGNDMFNNSNNIPASLWLTAIAFFIVLFHLVY